MRMRKMKNLEPRMERCAAIRIAEPAEKKGSWRSLKPEASALWVEVGCGKGKFTAETAAANPDVLLIAVERCREAMVVAMEKAQSMNLTNVFFIDMDVEKIEEIFSTSISIKNTLVRPMDLAFSMATTMASRQRSTAISSTSGLA